jgi:hypothetical protein
MEKRQPVNGNRNGIRGIFDYSSFIVCTQDTTLNVGSKGAWRLALGFESSLRDAWIGGCWYDGTVTCWYGIVRCSVNGLHASWKRLRTLAAKKKAESLNQSLPEIWG